MPYASDYHAPALLEETIERLVTDPTGVYVDATLGGGGHTEALLDALEPGGHVLGIDRDPDALGAARQRLSRFIKAGRLQVVHGNFGRLQALIDQYVGGPVEGVLLDLGVSSHQIDTPERGFSFRGSGPLDMRMDTRQGVTADQVVNDWSEADLRQLLYDYGEERRARKVAREIVRARPLSSTGALSEAVRRVVPGHKAHKTLARVFQAIRIVVNDELRTLESALRAGPKVLKAGGRMAVISYHSLEDRRVKRFFRYGNFENQPVRDLYGNLVAPWERLTSGPVRAGDEEVDANARARSARLRVATRRSDDAVSTWRQR